MDAEIYEEKIIIFFGKKTKVNCDRNCKKAWGINSRPKNKQNRFLKDYELGNAPTDPGTYECGYAKPLCSDEFPNKWCVRECERCAMSYPSKYMEKLNLPVFE